MFAIFPEFTELKLEDKKDYNDLIRRFPPFSDTSFTNLHIWWNLNANLYISTLNDNLIINYELPFDKDATGLGLIGLSSIDETIQAIFAHLNKTHEEPRLVHVPEFTIDKIQDKHLYQIDPEDIWHEYILDSAALASLEGHDHARTRREVNRFKREVTDRKVEIIKLDLSSESSRNLILESVKKWEEKRPPKNDPDRTEIDAIERTLRLSQHLDTQNICVFVDKKLEAFALYHLTVDCKQYIINHMRVDHNIPCITDYITHLIAVEAVGNNVPHINMEMDLGLEGLRSHKQSLRPIRFNRKFTVTPKI